MYFAVCDDNKDYANGFAKLLREYADDTVIDFFQSGEDLLDAMKTSTYDVIFLEIELPGMNGMETAKQIRFDNNEVVLIFLTNRADYAVAGYDVSAFQFFLKSFAPDELRKKLFWALDIYKERNMITLVLAKGKPVTHRRADIVHIKSSGRKLTVHYLNGDTLECISSLKDMKEKLKNSSFVQIHRSCLVNLRHAAGIKTGFIVLNGDDLLPIGRKYKAEAINGYHEYAIYGVVKQHSRTDGN